MQTVKTILTTTDNCIRYDGRKDKIAP